jgi:hypothetical protein
VPASRPACLFVPPCRRKVGHVDGSETSLWESVINGSLPPPPRAFFRQAGGVLQRLNPADTKPLAHLWPSISAKPPLKCGSCK